MILRYPTPPQRRRGHTIVEFALVAPLVFLLIIGCLEWCLYMMTLNQCQNAAREGARYAVVRTDIYQSFPAADTYLNQNPPDTTSAGNVSVAAIQAWVQNYLNQAGTQINNLQITVYKVNSQGQPVDLSGAVLTQAQATAAANEGVWYQTSFGQLICVQISGTYKPVIPGLTQIGLAPPVLATAAMSSEGN
jgi:Flp pilus assembly protein TadG